MLLSIQEVLRRSEGKLGFKLCFGRVLDLISISRIINTMYSKMRKKQNSEQIQVCVV